LVTINKERLLNQLKKDEGFSPVAFWDIKQFTYGYGCLAPCKGARISEPEASRFLEKRLEQSIKEFSQMFPGALDAKFNDVRAEAIINMLFNMGMGRCGHPEKGGLYSFTNTLSLIYDYAVVDWAAVASNLDHSKWDKQVEGRADRIEQELKTGVKQ
jgi:GH24 family phage-related lysozyme (muramidase)